MHINQHQGSELVPKSNVETPVKRAKTGQESDAKTAESPNKFQKTIKDVDTDELFNNFSKIVSISETHQEFVEESPFRRLDFDIPTGKLNFDQSTASMKKKRSNKVEQRECIKIKPFLFSENNASEANKDYINLENDTFSPKIPDFEKDQTKIMRTPTKKQRNHAELENAAYKEDPYRDLPVQHL